MLERELRELLPQFFEWLDIEGKTSFYPRDVSEKFSINEESAKKLIKIAIEEGDKKFRRMLDGKVIIL